MRFYQWWNFVCHRHYRFMTYYFFCRIFYLMQVLIKFVNLFCTLITLATITLTCKYMLLLNSKLYCGIIIVCGGSMFVDFVGKPCPGIYIPWNLYTINCLMINELSWLHYQRKYVPTNQETFGYQQTLNPTNKSDSTVNLKHFPKVTKNPCAYNF